MKFCVAAGHNSFGVTGGNTCVCSDTSFDPFQNGSKDNCTVGCTENGYEQSGDDSHILAFSTSSSLMNTLAESSSATPNLDQSAQSSNSISTPDASMKASKGGRITV